MSRKNAYGDMYHRHRKKMDKLIDTMTKREKDTSNRENMDSTYNTYRINAAGSRVWTF